jgi:hypothetical protein
MPMLGNEKRSRCSPRQVSAHRLPGLRTKKNDSLARFSGNANATPAEVNILDIHCEQFADPAT